MGTRMYRARRGFFEGPLEVESAEFERKPKSWRATGRTGLAFDCRVAFPLDPPPGFETEEAAIAAWVAKEEHNIARAEDSLNSRRTFLSKVKKEVSDAEVIGNP